MQHTHLMNSRIPALGLILIPLFAAACGGGDSAAFADESSSIEVAAGVSSSGTAPNQAADAPPYGGPSVGAAKGFSVLASSAISALSRSAVSGNLGLSGARVSNITGFEPGSALEFGTDASSPNTLRTTLTQQEVSRLVSDLDLRACDVDYPSAGSDATAEVTLSPGVTCLDEAARLSGRITLDAGGDPNAFFVVRSKRALTVTDDTRVVLANGAQACGVFWRAPQQVTLGKAVELYGNLIAGAGISMSSGSTLVGRALSQTGAVVLDGNTITLPVYGPNGSPGACSHVQ